MSDKTKKMMLDNPEQFPKKIQQSIKKGKITQGMNTLQASLAGGAYFFRVIADKDVWKEGIDPNIVIQAQTTSPDNSQIWMSFQNSTQYKEKQSFQVTFEQGKVISIKKIEGEQSW